MVENRDFFHTPSALDNPVREVLVGILPQGLIGEN